jgi:hypothetical protein
MKFKITYAKLSVGFFLAAILLFVCFVKINSGYSQEIGRCVINANHIKRVQESFGKKMRLCIVRIHPTDKQTHEWAEWWNEDRQEWCLWDRYKSWYTAYESGYEVYAIDVKPLDGGK